MPKSIRDALNRGNNLMMIVALAVTGLGVIGVAILESDLTDKADDIFVVVLGIIGVVWYLIGQNRYKHSWTPFTLVAIAFLGKIGAVFNELNDPNSLGDEYGVVVIFAALTIISGVIMVRSRRYNQEDEQLARGATAANAPIPLTGESEKPDDEPYSEAR